MADSADSSDQAAPTYPMPGKTEFSATEEQAMREQQQGRLDRHPPPYEPYEMFDAHRGDFVGQDATDNQ
jgi:hypothetical protein